MAAQERLAAMKTANEPAMRMLAGKIAHLKVRCGLPAARFKRLIPVTREICNGRYLRFSRGLLSAGVDLLGP